MNIVLSKRGLIRIITYFIAIISVAAIYIYTYATKYTLVSRRMESGYQRSLEDLADYVSNMSTTLEKAVYAGTNAKLADICAELWQQSTGAKTALSALPTSKLNLEKTYKFISQVGDYAMSLSRKSTSLQKVSDEDRQTIVKMSQTASKLSQQLFSFKNSLEDHGITLISINKKSSSNVEAVNVAALPNIEQGFTEMEEGLSQLPTLIYDGPFSDHIMQKKPIVLKNKSNVLREVARKRAANAAGVSPSELLDDNDEDGNMPSYCFKNKDNSLNIGVTKAGGYVSYILDSKHVGEIKLSYEDALKKARKYLDDMNIGSMKESYYEILDGVCTINFAYLQKDIIMYTDLVKIGVALDDGKIMSFDARGYLTNHQTRNLGKPKITQKQAQQKVSTMLTVKSSKLAVIPSLGLNEIYAYEFSCVANGGPNKGRKVLVYVNAQTGFEEQILILLVNENGVLTE